MNLVVNGQNGLADLFTVLSPTLQEKLMKVKLEKEDLLLDLVSLELIVDYVRVDALCLVPHGVWHSDRAEVVQVALTGLEVGKCVRIVDDWPTFSGMKLLHQVCIGTGQAVLEEHLWDFLTLHWVCVECLPGSRDDADYTHLWCQGCPGTKWCSSASRPVSCCGGPPA